MHPMIMPPPLQPGDRVALVAPCSPLDPEQLAPAADFIRKLGYTPEIYPSCRCRRQYLAGDDLTRAADLNRAFADPWVKAVIAVRGGYGSARLISYLDAAAISSHPKLFCGYSDVTVLHGFLNQRCHLITFHTPMPGIAEMREDSRSREAFAAILRGDYPHTLRGWDEPLRGLCPGRAGGILTGGNLTVLASTVGTPYQRDTDGCILFLEDVNEKPYAIDRVLLQLRDGGLLGRCAGILLGTWRNCGSSDEMDKLFREWFAPLGIPVVSGIPCGHSVPSMSLPLGGKVILDADSVTVRLIG